MAVFLPPPANIKDEPTEKPERLGKTIKQLAWCRKQTLDGKIKLAQTVLKSLLAATDQVAVAFSGGRDSLVALHLMLQLKPDVPVMLANTGIEFPESVNYIRQLAKTWKLNFHEAKAGVSPLEGKVGGIVITGDSDGAQHIIGNVCNFCNAVGLLIPPYATLSVLSQEQAKDQTPTKEDLLKMYEKDYSSTADKMIKQLRKHVSASENASSGVS